MFVKKLRDVQQERKEIIFLQVYNYFKQVWYCKHQNASFILEYLHCHLAQNINLVLHIAASWRPKYQHSGTYPCIFSVLQLQSFLSFDLRYISCQSLYPLWSLSLLGNKNPLKFCLYFGQNSEMQNCQDNTDHNV